MGDRAQLMIMEKGSLHIHYDHWGSERLPGYLFWGPKSSLSYFRRNKEIDEWLDEVWCDGAALMDLDKKFMCFFGGDLDYHISLRDEYLRLMAHMWPGWHIRWADDGLAEMADYAGFDRQQVIRARRPEPELTRTGLISGMTEPVKPAQGQEPYACLCLSFRSVDNEVKYFNAAPLEYPEVLLYGPDLVDICRQTAGLDRLDLDCFPAAGIHIDEPSRSVEFWKSEVKAPPLKEYREKWPGYEIKYLGGGYQKQLDRSEGRLTFRTLSRAEAYEEFKRIACVELPREGSILTMVRKIAAHFTGPGQKVMMNPYISSSQPPKLPSLKARIKKFDQIAGGG